MMTGSSGWRSLIWGSISSPLWPGRARSSSTRSKFSWSRILRPSTPSPATLVVYPSSESSTSSDSRIAASSSITRMLAWPLEELDSSAVADADAGGFNGNSTSDMNGIPQQGKLKMEGCAGADGAFDMNFAGVFLDDAVGNGKPQACAAAVAGPDHGLGGEEGI